MIQGLTRLPRVKSRYAGERKARVHEPVVEPLESPAAASVRSRPPTEALGSSDHGPRLEDAHAEAKRSRGACGTRRCSAELGLLAEFVTCRVDGVKGGASPSPRRRSSGQSRRARGWARDICAMPAQGRSRIDSVAAAPPAVHGDAARGAIDAARRRMIDRRGSVVTAEPDEECLLWRAMTTSRKCVLCPCRFDDPRVSPPPLDTANFDTANLEARPSPASPASS